MPRVLYIGSGSPWQGGAGFLVRQQMFLGALANVADLHLAMFDSDRSNLPPYATNLVELTKPVRRSYGKLQSLLADKFDPLPRSLRGYDLTIPWQQAAALNPAQFDAVFGYRIDFSYFAGVLDHPRLILDIDDPEHLRNTRRLRTLGLVVDPRTTADIEKLRRFEQQAVAKAKLAFVCQPNDQEGWAIRPEVVPNCVQVPADPPRQVTKPIVLFVGNCAGSASSPNVDAVRFFIADIWPKIRAAAPAAEFHIVGATSDAVRQPAKNSPGILVRGFVDDLAAIYAQAAVSVAPIRFGTGTRIKILDAFAHACPVVSTLPGAEGIDAVPARDIELAGGPDDFADLTIALLNDPIRNQTIGRNGHALAIREYDTGVQQRKLQSRFQEFFNQIDPMNPKAAR
jgi:hypothetical protein